MTGFSVHARPIQILLVEDNPADVELTRQGLQEGQIPSELHVATRGDAALDFLHRRGAFEEAPCPDLILLDLNLPGKDGRDVLAAIKGDPQLQQIPVIVLTTSNAESDVLKTYQLHANAYMTKPVSFGDFVGLVKAISDYWFSTVVLPPKRP